MEFPIIDKEWRFAGDVDGDAREFLNVEDTPFSIASAQQVVKDGANLVGKYDAVRPAARRIQEIRTRTMGPLALRARDFSADVRKLGG